MHDDDDYDAHDPEGPDPEEMDQDTDELSTETVECPHCGTDFYQQAERCPACGSYLSAEDSPQRWGMGRWMITIIILLVLITFVLAIR